MNQTTSKPASQTTFSRVAENLYRSSSGGFYVLVKRSGKQIRKSLKTTDRKLAERRLRDFLGKVDRLDFSKGRVQVEFNEWAKRWLDVQKHNLKVSSHGRRVSSVKQLKGHFGASTIRGITRAQCEDWASARSPKVAASTYNNERETLIAILDYAVREGVLLDNPARILTRKRGGKTQLIIPTREHFETLVKTMRSMDRRYSDAANLVELLAHSGMRKGEANAFRWADIDLKRGLFAVTGGETGTKNHDIRMVPLFPVFREFLERRRKEIGEPKSEDLVVSTQNAKKAIEAICRKKELPHFNHHSMRHYFVSNAIEKGVDFKTIAAWVGHKDGGVLVAQTYGHLRDTHSMEMAKLMTA